MVRRFTRVVRGAARSVRQNVWLFIDVPEVSVAVSSKFFLASLDAAALALRPFTVIRTHILISWATDQTSASEEAQGALGEIVVSDQASAAGIASIPSPISNADAPWYVWQAMAFKCLAIGTPSNEFHPRASYQYEVDSKSMRKVGINEDIVMVVENLDATHVARVSAVGRFMVKLH